MKDIDNNPAFWPAEARPWYKRLVRFIYKKVVNEVYLPKPVKVELVRQKQKISPKYNKITHIVLNGKGYETNGTFITDQFGNEINEQEKK